MRDTLSSSAAKPATSWRMLAETLEPRILHSADLSPLGWGGVAAVEADHATHAGLGEATPTLVQGNEIAFIDAGLPDAESLIADLLAQQAAGRRIEVVTIAAGSDGLARVGQALAGRSDIAAVHLLAHGSDGRLQLGGTVLDAGSLLQRADELAAWGTAFSSDADLLLYGCDLAQGATGQRLLLDLAALTGADVAASTNLTGAAARGGNWALEYRVGAIEAALAPSVWQQTQWQGVLATYTVTSTSDFIGAALTPGTLRWAISQANANVGADRIVFAVNGSFNILGLTSGGDDNLDGDFDINGSLEIVGNGSGQTIIAGNGADRVFDVRSGTVTMSGLTVRGGSSGNGAGLRVGSSAALTMTDAVVESNLGKGTSKGGGIYNAGTLTLNRVTVQNNGNTTSGAIDGAGIYNDAGGSLYARDVSIAGNTALEKSGGGLHLRGGSGSVVLQNVTLSGNTAGTGGGIFNGQSGVTLSNVTIAGNTATTEGGGLWSNARLTLDHVTVAANTSPVGGGVYDKASGLDRVVARNSLFAANSGGNTNIALVSGGYNLSDDGSLGFTATGDLANTPANIGSLANNGGYTRTVAIGSGSAARDAANPVSALGADQRSVQTFGGRADIGAYEYNPGGFAPTITSLSNQTIAEDVALSPLGFTVGDVESSDGSLVVTATSSNTALVPTANIVLGGVGANRSIALTPAANAHSAAQGTATITVTVSDGASSASTSFVVSVQSVNDRPTISLPATLAVDEDTLLSLSGALAPRIDDVDAGSAVVQVTLSVAQGTLTLSQTAGLSFVMGDGSGEPSMRFNGSVSAINAALDGLRYQPGNNFNGTDRLQLSVNDLGNSGSGGALSATGSVDIAVQARNDPPVLTLPGTQATAQPMALYFSAANGNALTLSDVDAGTAVLELTLDVVNGTVSFGSLGGLTLLEGDGSSDARVVARGTVDALNAALDTLSFNATTEGPARIDMAVDDLGNSGAGSVPPATGSVLISVSANAPPVLNLANETRTFTEGSSPLKLSTSITVNDADSATLASARVSIGAGYSPDDMLVFVPDAAQMGNISGSYSAGVLTLVSAGASATLAQWQDALRAVSFFNTSDSPSTAPRMLSLTVNDGNADSAARQFTLNVVAVNDAPVLGGVADLRGSDEDDTGGAGTSVAALIAGFVSDVDRGPVAGIAVVGVDDSQGTWQYSTDGGVSWNAFGSVSDTQARLLQADELSAVRFVPRADWNGSVAGGLRLRAWDQTDPGSNGIGDASSNGAGTAYSSFTASASIVVRPVNDAPAGSVTITGTPIEDQTLSTSHNLVDVDGPATLAVSYQWRADGVDIAGATASTLLLGQAQVGKVIDVVARYTDDAGTPEQVTSGATAAVSNVDDAPSGSVTISGVATQGAVLTAAHSLSDADGPTLVSVHYQWQADGVDLAGATSDTLLLGQTEVGKAITVTARYVDDFGNSAGVTSAAAAAVTNVNDAPTGSVTLSGVSMQGQTLTAANTLADPDGPATLNIAYQWQADGVDIAGATGSTLVLGQGQIGKTIRVVASYTDAFGAAESVTSAASAAVANVNDAPTGSVTLSGTPTQGQTLTAANNLADADGPASLNIAYQWQADDVDITGATGSTLVLGQGQVGKSIRVVASYTDAFGTPQRVTSGATAAVANVDDAPTGGVTISGVATQGQTFTAANTLADADGPATISVDYQWQADGVDITGATGATLLLGQAEVGKVITVTARYVDDFGDSAGVTSAASAAVANINDAPTGSVSISGTLTQGQTLTAANTLADADGPATLSVAYQWQADGVDLTSATASTLVLGQAEVGKTIRLVASYTDAFGAVESVTSATSAAVVNVNDAPIGSVTLSGIATQGQTLTAGHTLTDDDGPATLNIAYQWQADGVDITGAPGSTLVLGQAHVGKTIRVVASYTDAFGAADSLTSAATAAVVNVNDAPTGSVTLSGMATQGQTLIAGHTLADADGPATLNIAYQWQADGVDITGATGSTLVLGQGQVGKAIRVVASYIDAAGIAECAVSTPTAAVAAANSAPVLAQGIADQAAVQGAALQFALPPTTFTDTDPADTLSYAAALANGSAVPQWIRFDAASQVFVVTPPQGGQTGPVWVRVVATDTAGASAQLLFAVVVLPAPVEEPVLAIVAAPSPEPAVVVPPAPAQEAAVKAPAPTPDAPPPQAMPARAIVPEAPGPVLATAAQAAEERVIPPPAAPIAEVPKSRSADRSDALIGVEPTVQYTDLASAQLVQLLHSEDMLRKLDELKRQMLEATAAQRSVVASSVVVTSGLSVGYVVWLVRGGVLVSSMLSALPAWQLIDPMPVLAAGGAARGRAPPPSDEPEVERLFSDSPQADRAAHTTPPVTGASETNPAAPRRAPTAAEPHP